MITDNIDICKNFQSNNEEYTDKRELYFLLLEALRFSNKIYIDLVETSADYRDIDKLFLF